MQQKSPDNQNKHIPVLLGHVLKYLDPKEGETYLDLTAGYGGHAKVVLERTLKAPAVLVDRDSDAVDFLEGNFKEKNIEILHQDFYSASLSLQKSGRQFDIILADLGVSSPHLNMAERGFSFRADNPLDMRMDRRQELTAEHVVNSYSEAQLTDILIRYGEEPKARRIAREIVQNRPLKNTKQLAELITRVWPFGKSKVHPATRVFQAIRIEVNNELDLLQKSLPIWINLLRPGGRLGIISFHSLEDRIVKRVFNEAGAHKYEASLKILTKKPVSADKEELVLNPRARSAKLRVAAKIKITKKEGIAQNAHTG